MEAAEPIVRGRRVRQFRTTEEKRLIVEETCRVGVSVSTVAQAHGINANQVFYWRKLYEAGQLESTVVQPSRDLGARGVRLLPVSVDEGAERQAPVTTAASTFDIDPACHQSSVRRQLGGCGSMRGLYDPQWNNLFLSNCSFAGGGEGPSSGET
jgi:transposase-like protein